MFPSKAPLLYILHVATVWSLVALGIIVGAGIMHEPLSLLLMLCLNYLPEFPLVHDHGGADEEEETVYDAEREGTDRQMGYGLGKQE